MNTVNASLSSTPKCSWRIYTLALLVGAGTYVLAIAADETPDKGNIAESQLEQKQAPKENTVATHVGKVDKALHEKLKQFPPGAKIRIGIWLQELPAQAELTVRPTGVVSDIDAFLQARAQRYAEANLAHSKKVKDFIEKKNGKINLVSKFAPLIYAEVQAKDILEIEALPEVDTIYEEGLTGGLSLNTATRVHGANVPWNANIVGLQARACVVEGDGIAYNNPYVGFGEFYNPAVPNIDQHATAVAGMIQSEANSDYYFSTDLRGHAWGAFPVLSGNSGNYVEANLVAATEWCVLNNYPGAHVVNHSYYVDTSRNLVALDRYLDHVSRNHFVLQVVAAGNFASNVTSPGKGWNTISVGSIDDKDTLGTTDDIISSYSNYIDPFVPGSTTSVINKPEVVAVGCHNYPTSSTTGGYRSTTNVDPWTGRVGCGTSYAAPAVVGTALLLDQINSTFKLWPEAIKAIIMATSTQNIEGSGTFSDKDGAGRIRTDLAVNLTQKPAQYKYYGFNPSTYTVTNEFNFSRPLNGRLRCALVWDSATSSETLPATDRLLTDLDLRIVRVSTGTTVATSASSYNAFEIVDVNVPAADNYYVQVNRFGTSTETSNYMGLACYF